MFITSSTADTFPATAEETDIKLEAFEIIQLFSET